MVRRVIQMVFKEVRGLHQAAYILAVFTFGSQLLALFRDRLLASEFGASTELDLYYAAFKIPDLLFVIFASALSVYVLIPLVAQKRDQESVESAQLLLSHVFTVFLVIYAALAAILYFTIPDLIPYFFPGLAAETETLTTLIRILLLQPLFLGVSSLFGVITQLNHRFVLYAVSPLLYNLGIIVGIMLLYPMFGLTGLVYGVVVGALLHMLVQVPFVHRNELRFRFKSSVDISHLSEVLAVSLPRALALSLNQITLLFLVGFASTMTAGSVAVFQFAYNLHSVPLAIIGVSYSVAAFPILADLFAKQDMVNFRLHINSALRHILFWSMPAIALIVVLRAQLVRVVLGAGAFNWDDTRLTAAVLAILAISLVAQAVNLLFIRSLYAAGYTRMPLVVALCGFVFSVGAAYGFHSWFVTDPAIRLVIEGMFRVVDVPGTEVVAIGFAYTLSMIIQSLCLAYITTQTFELRLRGYMERFMKSLFASLSGAVVAYGILNVVVFGINEETVLGVMIHGALAGIGGLVTIAWAYHALNMPEFFEVVDTLKRRFFKNEDCTDKSTAA